MKNHRPIFNLPLGKAFVLALSALIISNGRPSFAEQGDAFQAFDDIYMLNKYRMENFTSTQKRLSGDQWKEVLWTTAELVEAGAFNGSGLIGVFEDGLQAIELSIVFAELKIASIKQVNTCLKEYAVDSVNNGDYQIDEAVESLVGSCSAIGLSDDQRVSYSAFLTPFAPDGCNTVYNYTSQTWWRCVFDDNCSGDVEAINVMCRDGYCWKDLVNCS